MREEEHWLGLTTHYLFGAIPVATDSKASTST
jgi:hypothetical protein